jgi:phosphoserine phosphatase
VGADHGGLIPQCALLGRGRDREGLVAEAALELGRVDDLGELHHFRGKVLKRGEVQGDFAAAELDVPAVDRLQVAVLKLARERDPQLAAGGLGRILAELVEMGAQAVLTGGMQRVGEPLDERLPLHHNRVGLLQAGHEFEETLGGPFLDAEESLEVVAAVERAR